MVNLNFLASFILFICGVFSALLLDFGFKIKVGPGIKGFVAASVIGWFGAWLSATIEGWGPKLERLPVVPALFGALSLILVVSLLFPPKKN
ncbi:MAG: hypothetical protein N3B16_03585 [Candidatus Aminicenantes bacterium]|nr:hypothetical protein [Candidatus Aminicenantes bacterium]